MLRRFLLDLLLLLLLQVFRLAQMTVEYLLYVQDCLQTTNSWMQQDRGNLEKHLQVCIAVEGVDAFIQKLETRPPSVVGFFGACAYGLLFILAYFSSLKRVLMARS